MRLGQVLGIPEGHIRRHFLPFLLIQARVLSWVTEEFPFPVRHHVHGDGVKMMTVQASGQRTGLSRDSKSQGCRKGDHLAAPWTRTREEMPWF